MSRTLDIWRPDSAVFLRRTGLIALAVVIACGLLALISGFWQLALAGGVLILSYFLFNDYLTWRAIRRERWELTETALLHHGQEGESQMALADVTDVRTRFGWTVLITQKSGLSVEMSYLPGAARVAQRILVARAGLTA